MGWDEESRRPRRPRRASRLVPLGIALFVTFGAYQLLESGADGGATGSLLDRLAGAAGSLSSDLERRVVYDDGIDGAAGSGGDGYTFAQLQSDGSSPATWPCAGVIPIEINPAGAPPGYLELIDRALAVTTAASGFQFEVVGETGSRDFFERGAAPVLLGFADEDEVEQLAGDVAGIGGAVYAREAGVGPFTAVGGLVALDTDVFTDDLPEEYGEAIIVHELAHVLGLGHTDAPGELMQASGTAQTEFGPGDLAGLAHLREFACS